MRSARLFALVMAPSGLALVVSCAPVGIFDSAGFTSATGGAVGGSTYTNDTTSTLPGTGGAGLTWSDAGSGGGLPSVPSYTSLCGGSLTSCVPGAQVDTCAQGGNPGLGGAPPDASKLSCQVVAIDGGVVAQCGTTGDGVEGAPCSSPSDCGPEMGCVAGLTPVCRPYCCASLESCPADTYCTPAPMAGPTPSLIPVCVPVASCQLLGDPTTCGDAGTCAVVRQDGTASCVPVGTGTDGQACPCAAGYTCNTFDNLCEKLCYANDGGICPTGQFCQGGNSGWGDIGTCANE